MARTKKTYKTAGTVICYLLILGTIGFLTYDNYSLRKFYKEAEIFYKQAEICKWNTTYEDFCGIVYPKDMSIYFFDGVHNLSGQAAVKEEVQGIYYQRYRDALISVNERTLDQIKSTLTHELAHYYYENNMTDIEHRLLSNGYKLYCKNENEFFAYEVERYGFYKYWN